MDKVEAEQLLIAALQPLGAASYQSLVDRFVGSSPEWDSVNGPSGQTYNLQLQGFWDGRKRGPIRIMAAIDQDGRGRLGIVRPLTNDFIKAPDESFVGE